MIYRTLVAATVLAATATTALAAQDGTTVSDAPGTASTAQPRVGPLKPSVVKRRQRRIAAKAQPPGRVIRDVPPDVYPGLNEPGPERARPKGPLASVGTAAEAAGVSLHLLFLDGYFNNLGMGINSGGVNNTGDFIVGADFDMARIASISGGTVHVQEQLFPYARGNNITSGIGDLSAGYETFYNPTPTKLAVFTYEQKLLNDRLDVEFGRNSPTRAFNISACSNPVSCYNNILHQDGDVKVLSTGTWMARAAYNLTPAWYVQVGGYEDNPKATLQSGFTLDGSTSTGALLLAELGYKTDFPTDRFPQRYELMGFYDTSPRTDPVFSALGRSAVLNPADPALVHRGTSAVIANGQKVVWRSDGGLEDNPTPTSLVAFGSASFSPDAYAPVSAEAYGGLTLQSPLQSRRFDNVGFKVHWTQLSNREQLYLQESNLVSGGTGYNKSRESVAFEINAHVQLAEYVSIDPTFQYFANANNYYAPTSTRVARDGFFFGGFLTVGLGQMLGLSSKP